MVCHFGFIFLSVCVVRDYTQACLCVNVFHLHHYVVQVFSISIISAWNVVRCQSEPWGELWENGSKEVKAGDEWGGWNGNLRWSDLTWRWSWLPRGHGPSFTEGVIVLFPGPLAQVRQRRWVWGENSKRNRAECFFSHVLYWYLILHLLSFATSSTVLCIYRLAVSLNFPFAVIFYFNTVKKSQKSQTQALPRVSLTHIPLAKLSCHSRCFRLFIASNY